LRRREIESNIVKINDFQLGHNHPLGLIAGPCVIENEADTLRIAHHLKHVAESLNIPLIFKSSYDKANRSSISSYRGPGIEKGLAILKKVRDEVGIPILTDIHYPEDAQTVADVCDVIQIPAFLCRQTDLLIAAGETLKTINVKKGQFMSPVEMKNVIEKIHSTGNRSVLLTERGTFMGYNNLVVDMRSLPQMRAMGCPVVFDATHSVQLPGGQGISSGGQREYVNLLSRAAVAAGVDALFWEVHPEPDNALCDGPNALRLDQIENLLPQLVEIDKLVKKTPL
jgi:2-dehydro-3-deoxyphosphooctonate aldolase (KDO 8-P synthase)